MLSVIVCNGVRHVQPESSTAEVNFIRRPSGFAARPVLAIARALAAAFLLAGCSDSKPTEAARRPFEGATVRVEAPADPAARALIERHGRTWADRSGGRLELVSAGEADVRLLRPEEMGRLAGRLAPISIKPQGGQDAFGYERLLRPYAERLTDWGGKPLAVPLLGESLFVVYRADLVEDPRHAGRIAERFKARFRRSPRPAGPATWQEAGEIAAYFAAEPDWTAGEKAAVPRTSLPPLPESAAELDRDFHSVAASFARRAINQEHYATLANNLKTALLFSYEFNADSGEPAIAGPGFTAALEFLQSLRAYRPAGTAARPLEAFRSGRAVLALATLSDLPWLQEPGSPVRDRFGIWRVPGSDTAVNPATGRVAAVGEADGNFVPYYGHGGWLGGVDAACQRPEAALDLLMYLSGPLPSLETAAEPAWGGGPTRTTHLDDRSVWHNYGLSGPRTAQLVAALEGYSRATLLNPAYRLRVAASQQYMDLFAAGVRPALAEGRPAAAALQAVGQSWQGINPDRPARLHEYRLSMGLK